MVDGVGARRPLQGLVELPHAQPLEGLGVRLDGPRAERRDQLRGAGHQHVAGEDRRRVAPHGLGAGGAPTQGGLVHDVVVVKRGDVGQLDGDPGVAHLLPGRQHGIAELGGQEREDRSQPFASGLGQVGGGRVDGLIGVADDLEEPGLDRVESRGEAALELRGVQRQRSDHDRSIAARPRSSATGCGTTPRAAVTMIARPMATADGPIDSTTTTPSSCGSRKNMRTTRRM